MHTIYSRYSGKDINGATPEALHLALMSRLDEDGYLADYVFNGNDLHTVSLRNVWLERANFVGCNLRGTRFQNCNLSGACFQGADLTQAVFVFCNLEKTCFKGAKLHGCSFNSSVLTQCGFHRYAQVAFTTHGERGRMLTVIRYTPQSKPIFHCGCFTGDERALRRYIEEDYEVDRLTTLRSPAAKLRSSRLQALRTALKLLDSA